MTSAEILRDESGDMAQGSSPADNYQVVLLMKQGKATLYVLSGA